MDVAQRGAGVSRGMRIVLPFRYFPPESDLHKEFADFDWMQAIRMLTHTAQLSCRCPVEVITDVDTDLPMSTLKYHTIHRRLMLWNLEVCLKYLESPDFDRNTIMMDSDQLIYQDLSSWFIKGVELGVLIRRNSDKPDQWEPRLRCLNGVQFWYHKGKTHLQEFYRRALRTAERLPEDRLVWGADTDAIEIALGKPLEVGVAYRHSMWIHMINSQEVIGALSDIHTEGLASGDVPWPDRPVLDFRWRRKKFMAEFYRATILAKAVA